MKKLGKVLTAVLFIVALGFTSCSKDDNQYVPQPENPDLEQPVLPILPDNPIEN